MTNILAIDTATDACSVALSVAGEVRQLHELVPRQHSKRLLGMLEELVPGGDLRAAGIELIAFGAGPGSFTGLRIASSAAQGMAFAADLPAVGISTLACQALTAVRQGLVAEGDCLLSVIDARIDECYWALFEICDGLPCELTGPSVCQPELLPADEILALVAGRPLLAAGDGLAYLARFPGALAPRISTGAAGILPEARDLVSLAEIAAADGLAHSALEITPSYVQETIGWKKLAEQGKRS